MSVELEWERLFKEYFADGHIDIVDKVSES